MRININNWKVINNKLPLFFIFCFLGCLYLGTKVNYWYFLLFILIPFTLKKQKLNWQQILIIIVIILLFILLIIFAWEFSLINLINLNLPKIIREAIFQFFDNFYSKEISSFIKLILFNIKSNETYIFLKQVIDLGVVWLICISGFHLSLLTRIIKLIFKKNKIIGRYVNILVIMFYSYLLNFSYASIRILIKLLVDPIFYKFKTNRFDKIGFVGLVICLLNPSCFKNYGFILSFSICIAANLLAKFQLNNKIIRSLLLNIFAFLISIPFVIKMNHKISLFTFINAFIFTYISGFVFLYFFIFAWMPFMKAVHYGVMVCVYVLVGNISFLNIFIKSNDWPPYAIALYNIILFCVYKITYLIVYNNKI